MKEYVAGWISRMLFLSLFSITIGLVGCETKPQAPPVQRLAQAGFCDLPDKTLEQYVIAINIVGQSSSSGVATMLGKKLYIMTNRHNLPDEPNLENIEFRNYKFEYSKARSIILLGQDYATVKGLGTTKDYAVLTAKNPSIFSPLPLYLSRHEGKVVIPSYASRLFQVGRGMQWFTDDRFDRLDFNLAQGASGAPVITCNGEIAGLYTALISMEDAKVAGFKGLSTPISAVLKALLKE